MPDCPTCNRPVYFAERVTSIGKDWHRPCLRCFNQACKKTLSAGGHSEVSKNSHLNSIFLNSSMRASPTAIGAMVHCSDLAGEKFFKNIKDYFLRYGHGGVESHVFLGGTTGGTASVTGQ
uniref:LIM zinc-binding domain-containing protein n=1 Tax=Meloidogyne hapla TaxID=6305 RepID=A0A1I8BN26_MELHA